MLEGPKRLRDSQVLHRYVELSEGCLEEGSLPCSLGAVPSSEALHDYTTTVAVDALLLAGGLTIFDARSCAFEDPHSS